VFADQGFEFGDGFGVAAQGELGFEEELLCEQTELFELSDLVAGERLVLELGERRAAPERERLSQPFPGSTRLACCDQLPSLAISSSKRTASIVAVSVWRR
jgi:hypothetical protein